MRGETRKWMKMNASDCKACRELLPELASLSSPQAHFRAPHLASCESCDRELARYRALFVRLGQMPAKPSVDLSKQVLSRIAKAPAPAWAVRSVGKTAERSSVWALLESFFTPRLLVPACGAAFVALILSSSLFRNVDVAGTRVNDSVVLVDGPLKIASLSGKADVQKDGQWQPLSGTENLRAGANLRTSSGSKLSVRLPDGSLINLSGETTAVVARNWV